MKKIMSLALALIALAGNAQQHFCAMNKSRAASKIMDAQKKMSAASSLISHEMNYDVKFVHLDLAVESTSKFIIGNSKMVSSVTAPLDTFMVLLQQNLTIDSIWFNGTKQPFFRHDSMVKVKTPSTLAVSTTFTSQIWYQGVPATGGSALGDGFSNDVDWFYNEQVTWSLSEPFVAHYWWPCKQVLTDKIDSSWVFVTTDTVNMAGSNGVLENVVDLGTARRFEWKSRSPIDYYLISVAVARYKEYNVYAKPLYLNDSILIQTFVYEAAMTTNLWKNAEKPQIDKLPKTLEFFSELYGMYPFHKEKYGHCYAAIGGGMEHQTMSTMGTMMYFFINAHELAHQWWGDNVTCKSWSDIFINEGFASYSEHVAHEYLLPQTFASHLNSAHQNVMGFPGGSIHFTGSDTLDVGRIFDPRLTYDKGGAILHTLRFVTNNDSLWFNTLRNFQTAYTHSTASVKDFTNFYHTSTGIDPAQFFGQWYYGEGFPTFNVKWNSNGTQLFLNVTQTTSMPSVTPLFITPIEYRIYRQSMPDTIIRVTHSQTTENYIFPLSGKVTTVLVDQKNWLINATIGPSKDVTLGVGHNGTINLFRDITVSPNPSAGLFRIDNPQNLAGDFLVRDICGRELQRHALARSQVLDLGPYAGGIYFIEFYDENNRLQHSGKLLNQ